MAATVTPAEDGDVVGFLDLLEKQRLECERDGRYEDAELAKTRLLQVRTHEENRRREELSAQQLAERLSVEEAHMKELQEFNDIWDKKVAEFEAHASNLINTLTMRHKQEHTTWLEKARVETEPRTPRWSRDLLNLRKIQETLAKQKNYSEAAKTKAHADQVEAKEHAAWKEKRDAKISSMEEQFVHKQRLEMAGLKKRVNSGREEMKTGRKSELDRLLQRYHNVKTQLESQQKIIQHRVERYPLVGPTLGPDSPGPASPQQAHGRSTGSGA